MGRNKKETTANKISNTIEDNSSIINDQANLTATNITASIGNIKYEGSITVSILKGNKKIKTTSYHNTGASNLFKFFATCITGTYLNAEPFRPIKIKLFYNKGTLADAKKNPTDKDKVDDSTDFKLINEAVAVDNTSSPDNETISWSATCHFKIPYAWLKTNIINQACLYGKDITTNENFSAVYFFTTLDKKGIEVWDPLDVTQAGNNYNLIIDWKLTLTNQNN